MVAKRDLSLFGFRLFTQNHVLYFVCSKKRILQKAFIYLPINVTEPGKQAHQPGGAFSQATLMQVPRSDATGMPQQSIGNSCPRADPSGISFLISFKNYHHTGISSCGACAHGLWSKTPNSLSRCLLVRCCFLRHVPTRGHDRLLRSLFRVT